MKNEYRGVLTLEDGTNVILDHFVFKTDIMRVIRSRAIVRALDVMEVHGRPTRAGSRLLRQLDLAQVLEVFRA